MTKNFFTIAKQDEIEIIINRSRFIGRAFPILDEEDALLHIEEINEKYPDATHHCYAYVLGRGSTVQRFDDDGEPGGTAGMPILQVILQQGVEDVLVVVTRYFGGIKLGAGGLVRAYSKSAAEVIQKSGKKEMALSNRGSISVDYGLWGTLEYFLRQNGIAILDIDYQENVSVKVMTQMEWDNFSNMITEVTNGKCECKFLDQVYHSWPKSE
ncbi:MAG: YigZ family protein [Clostridiales bacterium]|nr:YigZ family protein [Clostridiales bacterium]